MRFIVACTGPSLNADLLQRLRAYPLVVVNAAFRLAPWAVALAANDRAWWESNPDAYDFAGRRFTANLIKDVERVSGIPADSCSGVLGLEVAKRLGATQIGLVGADFHGDHFFGKYQGRLRNTTPDRRKIHEDQFKRWKKGNTQVEVLNITPGTKLKVFTLADIADFAPHEVRCSCG
jgi:hypothetical protein